MRWKIIIVIVGSLVLASNGFAEPAEPTEETQPTWRLGNLTPGGRWLVKTLPRHIANDIKYTFWNPWHMLALAVGAGVTVGVHQVDDDIQDFFESEDRLGVAGDIFNVMGNNYVLAGATVSAFIGAKIADAPKVALTAGTMTEALALTQVFTIALKYATQRTRPDGSNNLSFPSGHASSSFAIATVVQVFYGPLYGIPSYAIATMIALSRLDKNKHFASDTVAGALLGTLIGLGTAQFHKKEYSNFFIMPTVSRERAGLTLVHLF